MSEAKVLFDEFLNGMLSEENRRFNFRECRFALLDAAIEYKAESSEQQSPRF